MTTVLDINYLHLHNITSAGLAAFLHDNWWNDVSALAALVAVQANLSSNRHAQHAHHALVSAVSPAPNRSTAIYDSWELI